MKRFLLTFSSVLLTIIGYSQQYCDPQALCGGDEDQVEFVALNGKTIYPNFNCSFVDDQTQDTLTMNINGGLITANNSAFINVVIHGYIDWNDDKAFTEDENVPFAGNINTGFSAQVVPPAGQPEGPVRLRVQAIDPVFLALDGPNGCSDNCFHTVDFTINVTSEEVSSEPSEYCAASGYTHPDPDSCMVTETGNAVRNIWVSEFAADNGFSNTSSCGLNNGYSDYTNGIAFAVTPGATVTGQGIIGRASGNNTQFLTAWVDWNRDFVFDDATERIEGVKTDALIEFNFDFAAPTNAVEGPTRLRLRAWDPTLIGYAGEACGSSSEGEVEDYTIYIGTPKVACPIPGTPADQTANLCKDDVTLTWEVNVDGPNPTGYLLSIGTNNPPSDILSDFSLTDTSYDFTAENLNPNTTYYWSVKAFDATDTSSDCSIQSFTTADFPVVEIQNASSSVDTVTICQEEKVVLDAVVNNALGSENFAWTGSNLSSSNTSTTTFTGSSAGIFTLYVSVDNASNCSNTDSVVVVVKEKPTAGETSGNIEICSNEALSLQVFDFSAGVNFQWQRKSGSTWFDISRATSDIYEDSNPLSGVSYRVIVSNEFCSDTTAEVSIEVYDLSVAPNISSNTGSFSFCSGDSITLTSDITNNVAWSTGSTDVEIVVKAAGEYTVSYTDANGCPADTATVDVIENATPSKPVITGDLAFCDGAFTTLSVNDQGFNVAWMDDEANNSSSYTVAEAGSVFVKLFNDLGCEAISDTLDITVNANPAKPTISTSLPGTSFCEGVSVELITDADSLIWNNDANVNTSSIMVDQAGSYYVTALNDAGCSTNSDTLDLSFTELPAQPSIGTLSGNEALCDGDSLVLITDATGDAVWSTGADFDGNNLTIFDGGKYTITVVDAMGCEATSDTLEIIKNDLPEKPLVISQAGDLLTNARGLIQWFRTDGTPVVGETKQVFEDAPDGSYYVEVTDEITGCKNRSDIATGIFGYKRNTAVEAVLYPNPVNAGTKVFVEIEVKIDQLRLLSPSGVAIPVVLEEDSSFATDRLAPGLYLIEAKTKDGANIHLGKLTIIR
ncbi:GEVED domain-containing protein [Luteibaculum oceani]|uniref:Fibronectin type-III domain-containing protein n=1 Tax=Luteibaculum oceani TaxID=1294296 RepID=A0A5C6VLC1_9FLAO|nr:GEVED domain-containing protein [Luteibaculum oceani]TXC85216.1 hypothetical protein FRX97_00920 [Luteibaculum oceani]